MHRIDIVIFGDIAETRDIAILWLSLNDGSCMGDASFSNIFWDNKVAVNITIRIFEEYDPAKCDHVNAIIFYEMDPVLINCDDKYVCAILSNNIDKHCSKCDVFSTKDKYNRDVLNVITQKSYRIKEDVAIDYHPIDDRPSCLEDDYVYYKYHKNNCAIT